MLLGHLVLLVHGGRGLVRQHHDDVLRLEVEVDDALGVHELDAAQDLPEEVAALGLRQRVVSRGDALEQLAALQEKAKLGQR